MNTMQHFAQKTVRYFSYIDEMMQSWEIMSGKVTWIY